MPVPQIQVLLSSNANPSPLNLSPLLSQETNAMLSSLIEEPTGTNDFSTSDVTLKGYDAPNGTTVKNYFSAMTPISTDYRILILIVITTPVYTNVQDVIFRGWIAPNTLQFEPRTGAFSFTVIGNARNLKTTDASVLFQRPGYFDGKWKLYADVTALDTPTPSMQIALSSGGGQTTPDFLTNDTIQLFTDEKFTIISVTPDPATSPPIFWTLGLAAKPTKNYPANCAVHLLTPYQRNLLLHDVVSTLFSAAGFPNEQYFFSAALPNLPGVLFAAPMNVTGLPGGFSGGIAAPPELTGTAIVITSPSGVYYATSPTSGFTLITAAPGFTQPPVDATNIGGSLTMFGAKRSQSRVGNPRFGFNTTMKFYAYDRLAGNKRYIWTVSCNADQAVPTAFNITTALAFETCTAGVWVWGGNTPVGGIGITTTTSTDLTEEGGFDAIGIDVDPATGTVFFTDLQLIGAAGSALTMNTSSYQPGGAGYVANRHSSNGPIVFTAPGRCVVFKVDGILGGDPVSYTFTVNAAGAMTVVWGPQPISPYIVGRSLKKNAGDGRWYALISDPSQGVLIGSWASDFLIPQTGWPTTQIAPPPPAPVSPIPLGFHVSYDLDLAVEYGVSNGPGQPCPMFALIGGTPLYISNTGSGYIAYADMTGLSVADALQQLSITVAGFFYLTTSLDSGFPPQLRDRWTFRSRSSPQPGNTIGEPVNASDQIDGDPGLLGLTIQPVYNLWTGYVSVQNENDSTIFGDTSDVSGSVAYANADGMNLSLKSRFVTSSSFASALAHSLYNYLGTKKRWVEVNRIRDGRTYEVGRTFHCNVDGANRQFQIIETDIAIAGMTVKVVGLEI